MTRVQAVALIQYLGRANAIVPTTGAEWALIQAAITLIEGVANGLVTIEVRPVVADANKD